MTSRTCRTLSAIGLLLCLGPRPSIANPPVFEAAAPEPEAAARIELYLDLLQEGRHEEALLLHDLRGMRQYLLERRLAELKTANPELTANDLEQLSAKFQTGELHPARLRQILVEIMQEGGYEGMQWSIVGYAPAPEEIDGYLVRILAQGSDGREKPILLGLVKLGNEWLISAALIEQVMGRRSVIHAGRGVPPPPEVMELANEFWTHYRDGTLNEAYAQMSPAYRERVPLLTYLQQSQAFLGKIGMPRTWTMVQGVETEPGTLFVGVNVLGSVTAQATLMRFVLMGQTWVVDDIQFAMPRPPGRPGSAPPSRPNLRPDLRPDLRPAPAIGPPPAPPDPPDEDPRPAAQPTRLMPDSPLGPD